MISLTWLMGRDFLVFGFALELGSGTTFPPTTWAVGYVRSPSILYTTASGEKQERVPYFATQYPDVATGVCIHFYAVCGGTLNIYNRSMRS